MKCHLFLVKVTETSPALFLASVSWPLQHNHSGVRSQWFTVLLLSLCDSRSVSPLGRACPTCWTRSVIFFHWAVIWRIGDHCPPPPPMVKHSFWPGEMGCCFPNFSQCVVYNWTTQSWLCSINVWKWSLIHLSKNSLICFNYSLTDT